MKRFVIIFTVLLFLFFIFIILLFDIFHNVQYTGFIDTRTKLEKHFNPTEQDNLIREYRRFKEIKKINRDMDFSDIENYYKNKLDSLRKVQKKNR